MVEWNAIFRSSFDTSLYHFFERKSKAFGYGKTRFRIQ